MEVIQSTQNDVLILSLKGRLDASTSTKFEEKMLGHINDGKNKVLLDFNELDYISSAGLRVLIMSAKKLKTSEGIFVLASLKEQIKEVFDIAGFTAIFTICDSVEEGLTKF